jgi:hypothetical protein
VALADCLDCSVRYLLEGKHGKHDDFELMLLNALIAAGIKLPKDHKPPDHFRRLYRAGKLSRKEIIKLMREEFINVRQLNEWTNQ